MYWVDQIVREISLKEVCYKSMVSKAQIFPKINSVTLQVIGSTSFIESVVQCQFQNDSGFVKYRVIVVTSLKRISWC